MPLFSGKTAEEKQAEKVRKYLEKRGINGISEDNYRQVENIILDLAGNGLMKTGMALSFAKSEEQLKVTYLSALVEQNWIQINQNDKIIKLLEEIAEK